MSTQKFSRSMHATVVSAIIVGAVVVNDMVRICADETPIRKSLPKTEPRKELFSGKVVLLQEALKQRGIKVADEMKSQAVLETDSGKLIPIAADWRGRAFFQDRKLRDRKVNIVGYRRSGIPYLQALIVYFFNEKDERVEFDYWCDICSIPMYEIKACECCQGPSRHRYRPAKLPDYLFQQGKSDKEAASDKSSGQNSLNAEKSTP